MRKVVVIVGPTASGKTDLGIKIAKHFNLDCINGDSVQVYKELNIGSAKITESEKKGIHHHLLDICSVKDKYSVFDFQRDARKIIDNNDISLIVGGTGLYIKSVLYDYEFNEETRKSLKSIDDKLSTEKLYQKLISLDPNIKIDHNNRRRVIRALELAMNNDLRSKKQNASDQIYDSLVIYLDIDKDELNKRLIKRLDKQLEYGFIEEVKSLKENNYHVNAIGYKELNDYLDGTYTLTEAKELIVIHSRQLAKRQKTFFKNQMQPIFLNALDQSLFEKTKQLIEKFLETKRKIYLIGMPLSGKTTLGKLLALKLNYHFIDLDDQIEKNENKKITNIINEKGTDYFRKLENKELSKIAGINENIVIACGGGIVEVHENKQLLNGIVIYLDTDIEVLAKRETNESRPLLVKYGFASLYQQRKELYEEFSRYTIINNGKIEDAIKNMIRVLFNENTNN